MSPAPPARTRIHATCVAIEGAGVLLRGPSGTGKSDLALRLMDRGALMVADDQVFLHVDNSGLIATPPETISGRMEVRGVGIIDVPSANSARISAVFDLVARESVPRLPERKDEVIAHGIALPVWAIDPFEASAPLKIALLANAEGVTRNPHV